MKKVRKAYYLSKRGKVWYCQFRHPVSGGILNAKSTGETNKTRAEYWASNEFDRLKASAAVPDITLSEYAAPFFLENGCPHEARLKTDGRPFGIKTRRNYRAHLDTDILPDPISALRVADISRADVIAFRSRVVDRRGRTRSAHIAVQVFKVILHDAIEDGILGHDPTLRIKVVPEIIRPRVVTDANGIKSLLSPSHWESERLRLAVKAAAWIGLRAGEVRGLRWEDLDPNAGVVHIRNNVQDLGGLKKPKWEKVRDAPYPTGLRSELEPLRGNGEGYVFAVATSGPLSYITLRKAMEKAANSAGLPGLTLHGLRHTVASLLRGSGAHDELIRASFGWSNVGTQEVYTHRTLYDLSPLGAAVDSILGGENGNYTKRMGRVERPRSALRTARNIRRRRG